MIKKKILALVMSCALFASMLPSTVLASIAMIAGVLVYRRKRSI